MDKKRLENAFKMYDEECKRFLSNKHVLSRICKYLVDECKDMTYQEIESLFVQDDMIFDESHHTASTAINYDYKRRLDISDQARIILNIEIQNDNHPGYDLRIRAVYYASTLIADQYLKEFSHSHYDSIKKVYTIWLLPLSSLKDDGQISVIELNERSLTHSTDDHLLNIMKIIFVKTSSKHDYSKAYDHYDELLTPLSLIFTKPNDFKMKKKILEKYGLDLFLEEETRMCNIGEGIYREAKLEGIEQGIEQGVKQGQANLVYNLMKKLQIDVEEAMDMLSVTLEDKNAIRELIAQMSSL